MIENGTKVIVDGIQAVVKSSFASGRHRQYSLNDGRTIIDLHVLIADNRAKVLPDLEPSKVKEFRRLPKEADDFEE